MAREIRDSKRHATAQKQSRRQGKVSMTGRQKAKSEGERGVPAVQRRKRCRVLQISDKLRQAILDKADRIEISEIGVAYTAGRHHDQASERLFRSTRFGAADLEIELSTRPDARQPISALFTINITFEGAADRCSAAYTPVPSSACLPHRYARCHTHDTFARRLQLACCCALSGSSPCYSMYSLPAIPPNTDHSPLRPTHMS
jgi:hypothetical protein